MIYLLDLNVCITYLRGKNLLLKNRVDAHRPAYVCLCAVVVAELFYGVALSQNPAAHRIKVENFIAPFLSLPFDNAVAERFGNLRAYLENRGPPIGPYDFMIAATAQSHRLRLVTNNTAEFSRVPGLPLEDWQIP